MGFDKKAPGAGAEVYCTLEPGKAILEWKLYVTEEEPGAFFRILVYDKKDMLVLEGRQCVGEEELLRTLLLHPHLWRGPEDAYLYRAEIFLVGPGERGVLDKISFWFPIRSFREVLGKGWYLNGEPFCRKTVRYEAACLREEAQKELSLFVQMGANTVSIESPGKQPAFFYRLCEELGLVVWVLGKGEEAKAHMLLQGGLPTSLFYRYKARWSTEPFVYISLDSLRREKDGNFSITVYSSQKKAALYVDGVLFEFQSGQGEFIFREIPFSKLFLCLTAEAGECTMSLTVHKTFTKASLFHDNYPLECSS